jgi:two-component system OmpR family sensor kinase
VSAAPAPKKVRRRPQWSLQTRLIAAVVGMVTLILAMIGVATSALLGNILSGQLDNRCAMPRASVSAQLLSQKVDLAPCSPRTPCCRRRACELPECC